ncbi:MAG: HNH endonuclease [Pirellulaceae bacterium]|nr:HNH endonuclease [Pirellulaceae bacterium]
MVAKMLQRPALVLNRNWQPVNVATVARALVLLWNESARVVDPTDYQLYSWEDWSKLRPRDDERFIQAVRFRLCVPEVITLTGYDRLPSAAVAFSRRNIFKRDHYTCQYCGRQPGVEELTIDHVVPRAQGGESRWDNCVLACLSSGPAAPRFILMDSDRCVPDMDSDDDDVVTVSSEVEHQI